MHTVPQYEDTNNVSQYEDTHTYSHNSLHITRLKCRDFGFCLGNDVGWNPHER